MSFEQLSSEIGPGTGFTLERLMQMAADQEEKGEDFNIQHGDTLFYVPIEKLREFFSVYERPKRTLSVKEENAVLKKQMADMKAEMDRLRGGSLEPKKEKFGYQTAADMARKLPAQPHYVQPAESQGLDDEEPIGTEKPAELPVGEFQELLKGQISGGPKFKAKK